MIRTLLTLIVVGALAGCSPVESTPDKNGRGQTLTVKKPFIEYSCYLSESSAITSYEYPIKEYHLNQSNTELVGADGTKRVLSSSVACEFRHVTKEYLAPQPVAPASNPASTN